MQGKTSSGWDPGSGTRARQSSRTQPLPGIKGGSVFIRIFKPCFSSFNLICVLFYFNRSRRSVQFERRPSQRYARRQSHVLREKKKKETETKQSLVEQPTQVNRCQTGGFSCLGFLAKKCSVGLYCLVRDSSFCT